MAKAVIRDLWRIWREGVATDSDAVAITQTRKAKA
jgi:hypothetical protein